MKTERSHSEPKTKTAVKRRRTSTLSKDEIVETALRQVRKSGLEKLSMRSLASALDVTPMALYHYFTDRKELTTAICDAIFSEIVTRSNALEGSWKERLFGLALLTHEVIRKHSGIARVMRTAPARRKNSQTGGPAIPHLARLIDRFAMILEEGEVAPDQAAKFFHTVLLVIISAIDQVERQTGPGQGRKKPTKAQIAQTPHYAAIYPHFFDLEDRDVIMTVVDALLIRIDSQS